MATLIVSQEPVELKKYYNEKVNKYKDYFNCNNREELGSC